MMTPSAGGTSLAKHFTSQNLHDIAAWAMWRTTQSLGIIEKDDLSAPENAVDLLSASKGHKDALQEFANAHGEWYEFHLEMYKAGTNGNLSQDEHAHLKRLDDRRHAARDALMAMPKA